MKLSPTGIRKVYPDYEEPPRSILKKPKYGRIDRSNKPNPNVVQPTPPRARRLTLDPLEASKMAARPCSPSPGVRFCTDSNQVCSFDKKAPSSTVKGAPIAQERVVDVYETLFDQVPTKDQEEPWWVSVTKADYLPLWKGVATDAHAVELKDGTIVDVYGEIYPDDVSPSNMADASGRYIVEPVSITPLHLLFYFGRL